MPKQLRPDIRSQYSWQVPQSNWPAYGLGSRSERSWHGQNSIAQGESCRVECDTDRRRNRVTNVKARCGQCSYLVTLSCRRLWGRSEHQSKFADLHLIGVRQHSPVHGFTVDVRAVEATDVDNLEFAAYAPELGMPAADSDVIEEDTAIRVTTGRRGGPVEQEPRAGVRPGASAPATPSPRQRLRTRTAGPRRRRWPPPLARW